MTIFYWALVRSLRQKFTLFVLCIVPLVLIFIRPWWGLGTGLGFTIYGLVLLFSAFLLVRAIFTDRLTGAVVRIFTAPVTTFQYLTQNLLAFWGLLAFQIGVMVTLGMFLYNWTGLVAMKLFLCYIFFASTAIALSLAWDSLFQSRELSDTIFSMVVSIMALLGGSYIPITMLPAGLQKVGMLFPNYWLSSAVLAIGPAPAGTDFWLANAILLLYAVAFLLFGSKRRLE